MALHYTDLDQFILIILCNQHPLSRSTIDTMASVSHGEKNKKCTALSVEFRRKVINIDTVVCSAFITLTIIDLLYKTVMKVNIYTMNFA